MNKVLVINGPNLNLLGTREPDKYGKKSLSDIEKELNIIANDKDILIEFYQSNSESEIVTKIQNNNANFILINAAAYTHTSIAIRDALLAKEVRFIEIHISNIYNRENFRKNSYLSDIAYGCIVGLGTNGYNYGLLEAVEYFKTIKGVNNGFK